MRHLKWLSGGVCLILASATLSGGEAEIKALVAKAIKAMGGEENLGKLKAYTTKSEGKTFQPAEAGYTEEGSSQLPDHYRFDFVIDVMGQKIPQILVFAPEKGWQKIANFKTKPLPKEELAAFRDYFYALRLATNPAGLKDKEISLSVVGEAKVEGRDTIGIRITCKNRPDINLYFDKQTARPAKAELSVKDPNGGQELQNEFLFTSYKEMHGVQVATQFVWNKDGKKFLTRDITDLRPVERIDPSVFAEPQ